MSLLQYPLSLNAALIVPKICIIQLVLKFLK